MTVTSSEFLFTKLRCPVCGQAMDKKEASAICRGLSAHCFDFAKSGYLNLTAGHGGMGDLKDATDARHRFLSKGYYSILSDRIVELLSEAEPSSILDAGCGEGSYTNKLAAVAPVIGIDLSKSGILLAAKEAKRQSLPALYLVASLFTLPVANESFSAVTNLFAPVQKLSFAGFSKRMDCSLSSVPEKNTLWDSNARSTTIRESIRAGKTSRIQCSSSKKKR